MRSIGLMEVLQHLLKHANLTANGLAKILDLPTPTIHRLATGEVLDPRSSTLILIANYFGLTLDQLLGREPLGAHFQFNGKTPISKPGCSIPLVMLHETAALSQYLKHPTRWFRWQSNAAQTEMEKIFAVQIKNNLYEPIFFQESVLVVDPKITPEQGDYIFVQFEDRTAFSLVRYISEGKNKHLHSVNADAKPISYSPKEMDVIGVVIETSRQFRH